MSLPRLEFPEKMECLFLQKRYFVFYGGRGAGRSWGVARYLLLQGVANPPLTVLGARELQKSIDESVHKVLRSQIKTLELEQEYDVQRDKIYGPGGTEFSFIGVKNDPNKVRSYEGIDICWVEEANKVSKTSWEILLPTIRKKGSRIIITFNPEEEDDYTYVTFVTDLLKSARPVVCQNVESAMFGKVLWHETDDTVICKMDYEDNPWFYSDTELPGDMAKVRDDPEKQDEYLNVWKGHTRQNLNGAVYAKELRRAQAENRITFVPYEREVPVDTYWDIGKRDLTCIWLIQRVSMQWRILDFIEASQQELSFFIKELQRKPYVYGDHYLPHDAKHERLGQVHTIWKQLDLTFPRKVHVVPKSGRMNGINAVREVFPQCWFDEEKTKAGVKGLRRYRWKIIDGQITANPDHEGSDPADAFRTFAMARKLPRDGDAQIVLRKIRKPWTSSFTDGVARGLGWME